MRVTIEMYGQFQKFNKGGQLRADLDIEDDLTVSGLLASLGMDLNAPWNAGLNGTLAKPSDKLSEGSQLIVFPAVDGG
ncbi:MAG: MoaD/ThiS family protein [Pseudomonadota bacterium]